MRIKPVIIIVFLFIFSAGYAQPFNFNFQGFNYDAKEGLFWIRSKNIEGEYVAEETSKVSMPFLNENEATCFLSEDEVKRDDQNLGLAGYIGGVPVFPGCQNMVCDDVYDVTYYGKDWCDCVEEQDYSTGGSLRYLQEYRTIREGRINDIYEIVNDDPNKYDFEINQNPECRSFSYSACTPDFTTNVCFNEYNGPYWGQDKDGRVIFTWGEADLTQEAPIGCFEDNGISESIALNNIGSRLKDDEEIGHNCGQCSRAWLLYYGADISGCEMRWLWGCSITDSFLKLPFAAIGVGIAMETVIDQAISQSESMHYSESPPFTGETGGSYFGPSGTAYGHESDILKPRFDYHFGALGNPYKQSCCAAGGASSSVVYQKDDGGSIERVKLSSEDEDNKNKVRIDGQYYPIEGSIPLVTSGCLCSDKSLTDLNSEHYANQISEITDFEKPSPPVWGSVNRKAANNTYGGLCVPYGACNTHEYCYYGLECSGNGWIAKGSNVDACSFCTIEGGAARCNFNQRYCISKEEGYSLDYAACTNTGYQGLKYELAITDFGIYDESGEECSFNELSKKDRTSVQGISNTVECPVFDSDEMIYVMVTVENNGEAPILQPFVGVNFITNPDGNRKVTWNNYWTKAVWYDREEANQVQDYEDLNNESPQNIGLKEQTVGDEKTYSSNLDDCDDENEYGAKICKTTNKEDLEKSMKEKGSLKYMPAFSNCQLVGININEKDYGSHWLFEEGNWSEFNPQQSQCILKTGQPYPEGMYGHPVEGDPVDWYACESEEIPVEGLMPGDSMTVVCWQRAIDLMAPYEELGGFKNNEVSFEVYASNALLYNSEEESEPAEPRFRSQGDINLDGLTAQTLYLETGMNALYQRGTYCINSNNGSGWWQGGDYTDFEQRRTDEEMGAAEGLSDIDLLKRRYATPSQEVWNDFDEVGINEMYTALQSREGASCNPNQCPCVAEALDQGLGLFAQGACCETRGSCGVICDPAVPGCTETMADQGSWCVNFEKFTESMISLAKLDAMHILGPSDLPEIKVMDVGLIDRIEIETVDPSFDNKAFNLVINGNISVFDGWYWQNCGGGERTVEGYSFACEWGPKFGSYSETDPLIPDDWATPIDAVVPELYGVSFDNSFLHNMYLKSIDLGQGDPFNGEHSEPMGFPFSGYVIELEGNEITCSYDNALLLYACDFRIEYDYSEAPYGAVLDFELEPGSMGLTTVNIKVNGLFIGQVDCEKTEERGACFYKENKGFQIPGRALLSPVNYVSFLSDSDFEIPKLNITYNPIMRCTTGDEIRPKLFWITKGQRYYGSEAEEVSAEFLADQDPPNIKLWFEAYCPPGVDCNFGNAVENGELGPTAGAVLSDYFSKLTGMISIGDLSDYIEELKQQYEGQQIYQLGAGNLIHINSRLIDKNLKRDSYLHVITPLGEEQVIPLELSEEQPRPEGITDDQKYQFFDHYYLLEDIGLYIFYVTGSDYNWEVESSRLLIMSLPLNPPEIRVFNTTLITEVFRRLQPEVIDSGNEIIVEEGRTVSGNLKIIMDTDSVSSFCEYSYGGILNDDFEFSNQEGYTYYIDERWLNLDLEPSNNNFLTTPNITMPSKDLTFELATYLDASGMQEGSVAGIFDYTKSSSRNFLFGESSINYRKIIFGVEKTSSGLKPVIIKQLIGKNPITVKEGNNINTDRILLRLERTNVANTNKEITYEFSYKLDENDNNWITFSDLKLPLEENNNYLNPFEKIGITAVNPNEQNSVSRFDYFSYDGVKLRFSVCEPVLSSSIIDFNPMNPRDTFTLDSSVNETITNELLSLNPSQDSNIEFEIPYIMSSHSFSIGSVFEKSPDKIPETVEDYLKTQQLDENETINRDLSLFFWESMTTEVVEEVKEGESGSRYINRTIINPISIETMLNETIKVYPKRDVLGISFPELQYERNASRINLSDVKETINYASIQLPEIKEKKDFASALIPAGHVIRDSARITSPILFPTTQVYKTNLLSIYESNTEAAINIPVFNKRRDYVSINTFTDDVNYGYFNEVNLPINVDDKGLKKTGVKNQPLSVYFEITGINPLSDSKISFSSQDISALQEPGNIETASCSLNELSSINLVSRVTSLPGEINEGESFNLQCRVLCEGPEGTVCDDVIARPIFCRGLPEAGGAFAGDCRFIYDINENTSLKEHLVSDKSEENLGSINAVTELQDHKYANFEITVESRPSQESPYYVVGCFVDSSTANSVISRPPASPPFYLTVNEGTEASLGIVLEPLEIEDETVQTACYKSFDSLLTYKNIVLNTDQIFKINLDTNSDYSGTINAELTIDGSTNNYEIPVEIKTVETDDLQIPGLSSSFIIPAEEDQAVNINFNNLNSFPVSILINENELFQTSARDCPSCSLTENNLINIPGNTIGNFILELDNTYAYDEEIELTFDIESSVNDVDQLPGYRFSSTNLRAYAANERSESFGYLIDEGVNYDEELSQLGINYFSDESESFYFILKPPEGGDNATMSFSSQILGEASLSKCDFENNPENCEYENKERLEFIADTYNFKVSPSDNFTIIKFTPDINQGVLNPVFNINHVSGENININNVPSEIKEPIAAPAGVSVFPRTITYGINSNNVFNSNLPAHGTLERTAAQGGEEYIYLFLNNEDDQQRSIQIMEHPSLQNTPQTITLEGGSNRIIDLNINTNSPITHNESINITVAGEINYEIPFMLRVLSSPELRNVSYGALNEYENVIYQDLKGADKISRYLSLQKAQESYAYLFFDNSDNENARTLTLTSDHNLGISYSSECSPERPTDGDINLYDIWYPRERFGDFSLITTSIQCIGTCNNVNVELYFIGANGIKYSLPETISRQIYDSETYDTITNEFKSPDIYLGWNDPCLVGNLNIGFYVHSDVDHEVSPAISYNFGENTLISNRNNPDIKHTREEYCTEIEVRDGGGKEIYGYFYDFSDPDDLAAFSFPRFFSIITNELLDNDPDYLFRNCGFTSGNTLEVPAGGEVMFRAGHLSSLNNGLKEGNFTLRIDPEPGEVLDLPFGAQFIKIPYSIEVTNQKPETNIELGYYDGVNEPQIISQADKLQLNSIKDGESYLYLRINNSNNHPDNIITRVEFEDQTGGLIGDIFEILGLQKDTSGFAGAYDIRKNSVSDILKVNLITSDEGRYEGNLRIKPVVDPEYHYENYFFENLDYDVSTETIHEVLPLKEPSYGLYYPDRADPFFKVSEPLMMETNVLEGESNYAYVIMHNEHSTSKKIDFINNPLIKNIELCTSIANCMEKPDTLEVAPGETALLRLEVINNINDDSNYQENFTKLVFNINNLPLININLSNNIYDDVYDYTLTYGQQNPLGVFMNPLINSIRRTISLEETKSNMPLYFFIRNNSTLEENFKITSSNPNIKVSGTEKYVHCNTTTFSSVNVEVMTEAIRSYAVHQYDDDIYTCRIKCSSGPLGNCENIIVRPVLLYPSYSQIKKAINKFQTEWNQILSEKRAEFRADVNDRFVETEVFGVVVTTTEESALLFYSIKVNNGEYPDHFLDCFIESSYPTEALKKDCLVQKHLNEWRDSLKGQQTYSDLLVGNIENSDLRLDERYYIDYDGFLDEFAELVPLDSQEPKDEYYVETLSNGEEKEFQFKISIGAVFDDPDVNTVYDTNKFVMSLLSQVGCQAVTRSSVSTSSANNILAYPVRNTFAATSLAGLLRYGQHDCGGLTVCQEPSAGTALNDHAPTLCEEKNEEVISNGFIKVNPKESILAKVNFDVEDLVSAGKYFSNLTFALIPKSSQIVNMPLGNPQVSAPFNITVLEEMENEIGTIEIEVKPKDWANYSLNIYTQIIDDYALNNSIITLNEYDEEDNILSSFSFDLLKPVSEIHSDYEDYKCTSQCWFNISDYIFQRNMMFMPDKLSPENENVVPWLTLSIDKPIREGDISKYDISIAVNDTFKNYTESQAYLDVLRIDADPVFDVLFGSKSPLTGLATGSSFTGIAGETQFSTALKTPECGAEFNPNKWNEEWDVRQWIGAFYIPQWMNNDEFSLIIDDVGGFISDLSITNVERYEWGEDGTYFSKLYNSRINDFSESEMRIFTPKDYPERLAQNYLLSAGHWNCERADTYGSIQGSFCAINETAEPRETSFGRTIPCDEGISGQKLRMVPSLIKVNEEQTNITFINYQFEVDEDPADMISINVSLGVLPPSGLEETILMPLEGVINGISETWIVPVYPTRGEAIESEGGVFSPTASVIGGCDDVQYFELELKNSRLRRGDNEIVIYHSVDARTPTDANGDYYVFNYVFERDEDPETSQTAVKSQEEFENNNYALPSDGWKCSGFVLDEDNDYVLDNDGSKIINEEEKGKPCTERSCTCYDVLADIYPGGVAGEAGSCCYYTDEWTSDLIKDDNIRTEGQFMLRVDAEVKDTGRMVLNLGSLQAGWHMIRFSSVSDCELKDASGIHIHNNNPSNKENLYAIRNLYSTRVEQFRDLTVSYEEPVSTSPYCYLYPLEDDPNTDFDESKKTYFECLTNTDGPTLMCLINTGEVHEAYFWPAHNTHVFQYNVSYDIMSMIYSSQLVPVPITGRTNDQAGIQELDYDFLPDCGDGQCEPYLGENCQNCWDCNLEQDQNQLGIWSAGDTDEPSEIIDFPYAQGEPCNYNCECVSGICEGNVCS